MPIPEQRDLIKARDIVADWFSRQMITATDIEVSPLSGPTATGFSNETILFDASWKENGKSYSEGFVLRVKPTQHTVFLESDFDAQYAVLSALGEKTNVLVPVMKFFEDDASVLGAPFFVMGRIDGKVPQDNPPYTQGGWLLEEAKPTDRRTLVESGLDALAAVHSVDWESLNFGFLDKPQYGRIGFEQQLRYYEASFAWADPKRPAPPVAESALKWIQEHAPERDPEITLCWGDARINNQIFGDDYRVRAVLDWEMVTLADPMMDLGWWLFLDRHFHEGMNAARMEGFPTREEMVAHYEKTSGREARDILFYEVFAGLRFAVVMMRLGALLEDFGILDDSATVSFATNNAVTRVLADLLGLPSPDLTTSKLDKV